MITYYDSRYKSPYCLRTNSTFNQSEEKTRILRLTEAYLPYIWVPKRYICPEHAIEIQICNSIIQLDSPIRSGKVVSSYKQGTVYKENLPDYQYFYKTILIPKTK